MEQLLQGLNGIDAAIGDCKNCYFNWSIMKLRITIPSLTTEVSPKTWLLGKKLPVTLDELYKVKVLVFRKKVTSLQVKSTVALEFVILKK